MDAKKTKTLWKQIQAGERTLCVSLFHGTQELEWQECSIADARALLRRRMASGWCYRLSPWQWEDVDRWGDEFAEVERALGLVPVRDLADAAMD